jgi:hypothetical protein
MNCPHCGMLHQTTCGRIKAIEYNPDGSTKRIEFHPPLPITTVSPPPLRVILDGPANTFGTAQS